MLDRVEKIAIIDSINVDADEFFKVYRLAQAAGRILSPSSLPSEFKSADNTTVYATENSDHMIWAVPTKTRTTAWLKAPFWPTAHGKHLCPSATILPWVVIQTIRS